MDCFNANGFGMCGDLMLAVFWGVGCVVRSVAGGRDWKKIKNQNAKIKNVESLRGDYF